MWGGLQAICLIIYLGFKKSGNLHTYSIDSMILFLLSGTTGSLGIIYICKWLSSRKYISLLEKIGQDSLGIMVLHYNVFPFMWYANILCNKMGVGGFFAFLLSSIFVLIASFVGTEVLKNKALV